MKLVNINPARESTHHHAMILLQLQSTIFLPLKCCIPHSNEKIILLSCISLFLIDSLWICRRNSPSLLLGNSSTSKSTSTTFRFGKFFHLHGWDHGNLFKNKLCNAVTNFNMKVLFAKVEEYYAYISSV